MSLPWFRVYGEMVDDAKLKLLAFEDRWHYVAVLCCKTQGIQDSTRPQLLDRIMAAKLGLASREADEVKRRLIEVDLIGADWQPGGWEKRQRRADDAADRMRKFREKQKIASEEEIKKEDTDTDTDAFVTRDVTVTLHDSLPADTWADWLAWRKERRFSCSPTALKRQLALLAKYDTATQREMIDNSIQAGWQGLFPPKGNGKPRPTRYEELMAQARAAAPTEITNPLLVAHNPYAVKL